MFVLDSEVTGEVLENGVVRKVKGYLDDLMLVELHWKAGQEGALHTHPHRQCTYVLSGGVRVQCGGRKSRCSARATASIRRAASCTGCSRSRTGPSLTSLPLCARIF